MMVLGEFYTFYKKILCAQKTQIAHEQIKTKTVLKVHKNIKEEESRLFGIKSTKRT